MVTCSCCSNPVEDRHQINCSICKNAYAIACADITMAEARKIRASSGLSWSCKGCLRLGSDFNELKAVILKLQAEIMQLKSTGVPSSTQDTLAPAEFEKIVSEISEREKRKKNIIVFGLLEVHSSNRSDQAERDATAVREITALLGVAEPTVKPFRIGKYDPTKEQLARPLKVQLMSENDVVTVFRNTCKIKDSEHWSRVTVTSDRTPLQRAFFQTVKSTLDSRIAGGERDLRLVYKSGIPTIVSEN